MKNFILKISILALTFAGLLWFTPTVLAQTAGSNLVVSKKVINLTQRNLNWQTSINANPLDILSFAITMQAGSRDIHNVFVRDLLPPNLIYKGNLTVNASLNNLGNPSNGISVGTIPANGIEIISYQVQVAPGQSFSYGTTPLNNFATVSSNEMGTQTAVSTVMVYNSAVQGATTIPTGLANNFWTDSFLLPLLIILAGLWMYKSGFIFGMADWIKRAINK